MIFLVSLNAKFVVVIGLVPFSIMLIYLWPFPWRNFWNKRVLVKGTTVYVSCHEPQCHSLTMLMKMQIEWESTDTNRVCISLQWTSSTDRDGGLITLLKCTMCIVQLASHVHVYNITVAHRPTNFIIGSSDMYVTNKLVKKWIWIRGTWKLIYLLYISPNVEVDITYAVVHLRLVMSVPCWHF